MEKFIIFYFSIVWFIVLMNITILISSIIIHEFGHLFFGYLENCKAVIIAFNTKDFSTYTELECSKSPSFFVVMGGLLFTFFFSFLFTLLSTVERNFSIVILGLSFILAVDDLVLFGIPSYFPLISGIILFTVGEILFIDSKLREARL